MINFHQITNKNDTYYSRFTELYESAFPSFERRTVAGLNNELVTNSCFKAHALVSETKFVGIFNYWTFQNFIYIEHFAIDKMFRNQSFGTLSLKIFKDKNKLPIVLEVEMPGGFYTLKRIKFYESLGFKVLPHYYAQPPYDKDGFLMPMLLMTDNYHFVHQHFDKIRDAIYRKVYRYTEPNS